MLEMYSPGKPGSEAKRKMLVRAYGDIFDLVDEIRHPVKTALLKALPKFSLVPPVNLLILVAAAHLSNIFNPTVLHYVDPDNPALLSTPVRLKNVDLRGTCSEGYTVVDQSVVKKDKVIVNELITISSQPC